MSMDIEVNRYALRTFICHPQWGLKSLYREHYWDGGKAVAKCLGSGRRGIVSGWGGAPLDDHQPPGQNCSCGIYATLTLDQLVREYSEWALRCVAVIAAEGETVIGPKGLRTAAARIVAYWASTRTEKDVFDKRAPEAKWFTRIEPMLAEYHFPEFTVPLVPVWGWSTTFGDYDPKLRTVPDPLYESPAPPPIRRRYTSAYLPHPVIWGSSWNKLAPLMTAATPAGIAAVQNVTGYTPHPGKLLPDEAPKGTVVCTSATRPHNAPINSVIYQVDTKELMVYSKPDKHAPSWKPWSNPKT